MATDNMTTWDALLKDDYDGQTVANLSFQNRPFLAMLPKNEKVVGRKFPLPVIYGDVENRSATIATALAGATGVQNESFDITMVKNYGVAFIDRQLLLSADGNKGSFEEATATIDSMLNSLSNDLAYSLFRGVSGLRARVTAEPTEAATTVITLLSAKDIAGFNLGQVINFYSAETGGSQRLYATSVTDGSISAIDRVAGTVTIAAAYDSNGTIAANDFIFIKGDRGLKCAGLSAWLPTSAPAATSFFGVDRTVDTRLQGIRTVGTGMPVEEALIQAASDVAEIGDGVPDTIIMNPKQYAKLIKQLGAKVQYVDLDVNGVVGFRGVMVHGSAGPLTVMADRNCPDAIAYVLQMDTWMLMSTGSLIQVVDEDNGRMLRQSASDGFEVRAASYYNLGCKAPCRNGVVTLDA